MAAASSMLKITTLPGSLLAAKCIYDIGGFHGTIEEDLTERDFTMNALAVPLSEWDGVRTVVGNLDGFADAEDRTLRAVV